MIEQTPEQVRADLEIKTRQELIDELLRWRLTSSEVVRLLNLLGEYRVYGTPDEHDYKIKLMDATHEAEILMRDQHIQGLRELLLDFQKDPLRVGRHLEELTERVLKSKLN